MSSIIQNAQRIGNFTSSEIYSLMITGKGLNGFGTKAITYITKKNLERKLGRCISTDVATRPMLWGSFLEQRVFNMLEYGYELVSQQTDCHPTIECWSGSKDLIVQGEKIGDIKCYQPENFAEYSDVLMEKNVEKLKEFFPKEYWQLVSNAIINDVPRAEAIAYMPYQSELDEIRKEADDYDGADYNKYTWIINADDAELPYLPDDGYYNNINRFEFEVPQEDIKALTDRVLLAETMLIRIK